MSTALVTEILLGLLTAAITYAGYRLSSRALHTQSEAAAKAVDAGAYERAEKIFVGAISQLERERDALTQSRAAQDVALAERDSRITALLTEREKLIAEILHLGGTWPPPGRPATS